MSINALIFCAKLVHAINIAYDIEVSTPIFMFNDKAIKIC